MRHRPLPAPRQTRRAVPGIEQGLRVSLEQSLAGSPPSSRATAPRWVSRGCRQIDYYVTTGDSYAEIMEHYADVTGHAPPLPYWASGFWQCKLRYKTQDEFLEVAREFKQRGLPLAVHVIDFRHWKHLGDWKLDPDCWPDPEAMVCELDEMGNAHYDFALDSRGGKLARTFGPMKKRGPVYRFDRRDEGHCQFLRTG